MFTKRRLATFETPKIEVPKLSDEQIFILSALFVLNANEGFVEAERWLSEFETQNLLEPGALRGFLDYFEVDQFLH